MVKLETSSARGNFSSYSKLKVYQLVKLVKATWAREKGSRRREIRYVLHEYISEYHLCLGQERKKIFFFLGAHSFEEMKKKYKFAVAIMASWYY